MHSAVLVIVILSVRPSVTLVDNATRNPHAIASIKPRDTAQPQSVKELIEEVNIIYIAVQLCCTLKQ